MFSAVFAVYVAALFSSSAGAQTFAVDTPSCRDVDVSFAPGGDIVQQECSGGWLVRREACYQDRRSEHCPAETYHKVIEYRACEHEDFGPASYRREQVSGGHYFPALASAGVSEHDFHRQKQCDAEQELLRLRGCNPKYKFASVRVEATRHDGGHVWYERIFESIVDRWKEGRGPGCPIAGEHNGEPATYHPCRHSAHGEAHPSECGAPLVHSARPRLADVRSDWPAAATDPQSALQPPQCVTCEDLPLSDSKDAGAKFDCLMRSLMTSGFSANMDADHAAQIKRQVHRQLLLLNEFAGHWLNFGHRTYLQSLYAEAAASDPGCGAKYQTQAQDDAPLWASLYACRRLLLSHVPYEVLQQNNGHCQDVIKNAAEQIQLEPNEREALLWLMDALSAAALRQ